MPTNFLLDRTGKLRATLMGGKSLLVGESMRWWRSASAARETGWEIRSDDDRPPALGQHAQTVFRKWRESAINWSFCGLVYV